MIHAEWRMDDDSLDSTDVPDVRAAFDLAYDLLFVEEATAQVVVWLAGDRNVPTKLIKANITHLGQPYGWRPTVQGGAVPLTAAQRQRVYRMVQHAGFSPDALRRIRRDIGRMS